MLEGTKEKQFYKSKSKIFFASILDPYVVIETEDKKLILLSVSQKENAGDIRIQRKEIKMVFLIFP